MRLCSALLLALPLAAQTAEAPAASTPDRPLPAFALKEVVVRHEVLGLAPELLAERARLYFLTGNTAKAEEALTLALQKGATKGEVYRLAALALLSAGHTDRAFELHERMLTAAPKADDAMAHAAGDLVQAGHPEKADAMMERSYRLDPRDKDEVLAFAVIASRAGFSPLAAKWLGKLQGMDKSDARQEGMLAFNGFIAADRWEEAAALGEKILAVRSRDWDVAVAVAKVALRAKKVDVAKTWMERAEAIDRSDPRLLVELTLLARGLDQIYRY